MKTKKEIVAVVGNYYSNMVAMKEQFISARSDEFKLALADADASSTHDVLSSIVEAIRSHIKGAAVSSNVGVPAYRVGIRSYAYSEENPEISTLSVDFRNKLGSEVNFVRKFSFDVKVEDLVSQIYDAFITTMNELAYMEQAQEVIDEVNAKLAQIKEEHPEITVDVSFAYSDAGDDEVIVSITDDSVKFAAPLSGVLETTEMGMFQSGDNFADLCQKRDIDDYVEKMASIQFAPQVIKANIPIITKMLDMKLTRRADKILRRTYHKKAQFLKTQKEGIGYFCEAEKEDTAIFALVEKQGNEYNVVLSPFDVKTLEKVKVNVLKKCGLK